MLLHAEEHFINGEDFDRRIALISMDNSIEVSITTYLSLNPALRNGKSYEKDQKERWLKTYPSKLEFLAHEIEQRKLGWVISKEDILWVHEHRNEQYHGKDGGVPARLLLDTARSAALWVLSLLFNVQDIEQELSKALRERKDKPRVPPNPRFDQAIDNQYGIIMIEDKAYPASKILFNVDPDAYRSIGLACLGENEDP